MNKLQENISLTKLGGLNNSNYLITLQNSKYVLRIPSKYNTNNFYNENEILDIIKPFNISPNILYHNKDTGVLLSEFKQSNKISIEFYNSPFFINSLIRTLKKLHNLNCNNYFNPFEIINKNINILIDLNFNFDHDINLLVKKLTSLENNLTKEFHYGLCHNDLNTSNILYTKNSVYLIDFEFSAMGDIFFDLATLSWFLNDDMKNELIKNYFGYSSKDLKEKLEGYLFVVKLWNATWSFIKSVNSTSNYDYRLGGNMILDDLITSL
ncbi:phosphotransferase [Clostridium tertium]|uniref:phosphotransferase n=1 Tax=Clostridium tertium TaxID=1559 RepID=UPI00232F1258|nr:phosphotransferase [Clostridium tertium]MDB1954577.1 phosphotransferase [Clostridium tertium]MDB1957720.1 phosphotransferase [Clostridium tertium]MDB1960856.1 phosphotransferase [Clostridium tertium]MDB1965524.1 phosphotransferase [Clostridium tertium]